jgi:chlorobactene glucosyltransferase
MNMWGDPVFSELLAGGYLGLLSLMWLGLVAGISRWGRDWMLTVPATPPPQDGPSVSICIPARNEALNIGACVAAALASRWPRLEVVVVDDRSTDGTGDAARAAGDGDDRLHMVEGTEPPAGWAGKAWACARAAGEARSDLLLFLDADVQIHPDGVRTLLQTLEQDKLQMVSIFATWELKSFWERAVIPTVGWFIRGAVDLDRINDPGMSEAFANGQLILVRREGYDATGGHAAIKAQILDDVRLAERFKRHGLAIGMRVAPWLFRVRLYRSLSEIFAGYSKNLYEGMGRRPGVGLGAVLFIVVGTLLPFVGVAGSVVARLAFGWTVPGWGWIAWLAVVCGLQVAFRWRLERRDGRSGAIAWVHPLANIVLIGILLRSVFGIRAQWKGRSFVDGRAAGPS